MMQNFWTVLVITLASVYVIILDSFAFSVRGLQKSIVLPIIILLIIIYKAKVSSWDAFIKNHGKWYLLLWGTILAQTLVTATGGLQSPFLILIHLGMIATSFLFSFSASIFFLLLSFVVLAFDISFNTNILAYLTTNLSTIILQVVSLLTIVPLAYIISQQYHIKAALSALLTTKVKTDEAILESLDEMIIVTDDSFCILSLNDAVEQTIKKSRTELLNEPLFSTILLKDAEGKLVTEKTFFGKRGALNNALSSAEFTVINAPQKKKVVIQMQRIVDAQNSSEQYSFILSSTEQNTSVSRSLQSALEKARTKYEARMQALKQILQSSQTNSVYPLLMVEKIENDLYNAHFVSSPRYQSKLTKIDFALLCRNLIEQEQAFSDSFQVKLHFSLKDFGKKDIAQITGSYPVSPEELTGPFFTLPFDVTAGTIVIKKLLDIAVYLASSIPQAQVEVSLKRVSNGIELAIRTPNPHLAKGDLKDLFIPNYGELGSHTNLLAGSGLEGYLVQTLTTKMHALLSTTIEGKTASHIVFTWTLKKPEEA